MPSPRNITLSLLAALLLPTACQIHSPGQLDLARKLLDRYTTSFADALAVTEGLPAEEERLLAAYRSNFQLISSTEQLALLNANWRGLRGRATALDALVKELRDARTAEQKIANQAAALLNDVKTPLSAALSQLNVGLKKADSALTLNDQLTFISTAVNGAIDNVIDVQKALAKASEAAAAGPGMDRLKQAAERLKPLAPNLEKYFQAVVKGPTRANGQNAPLAVEATRLARDILAIEIDIIDQEIAYQEEIADLVAETINGLPDKNRLPNLLTLVNQFASGPQADQTIAVTLKALAQQGDSSEDAMRNVLDLAGTWYYVQIQSARAKDVHELKSRILAYRQAKLLDLAYDRQRRTLISYGLLAAVRYAEGGWRSEHTATLIGLIQAGLQAGLLAKI